MPRIDVEREPVDSSTEAIALGLRRFNEPTIAYLDPIPFNIVLRDDDGAIVGGCICETVYHWLYVDKLWVSETHRGQGLGSALLKAAEDEARRRGCTKAYLETLSFQARPFYEKLGWHVFGTQEDYPPGVTRYSLQKALTPTS